jgi:phage terminase small subunit
MALDNPRHQKFVSEYLIDFNATKAAERAGYSKRSALTTGSRLLKYADIRAAVDAGKVRGQQQAEMTAIQVLKELAMLARSDVQHYRMGADGHIALATGAPPFAMRAVSSVRMKRRTIPAGPGKPPIVEHDLEFRLWSKDKALENLAKHFALLVERHEVNLTEVHLLAVRSLSDLELSAFLQALDHKEPERALQLIKGGQAE